MSPIGQYPYYRKPVVCRLTHFVSSVVGLKISVLVWRRLRAEVYVLPMVKIQPFSRKFNQHLSLFCGPVKTEIQDCILVLVKVLCLSISRIIYQQFWNTSSNIRLKAVQFLAYASMVHLWHTDVFSSQSSVLILQKKALMLIQGDLCGAVVQIMCLNKIDWFSRAGPSGSVN